MPPSTDAPTICIIDSGIQENHRLIKDAMKAADSECHIPNFSQNDVADYVRSGGHGTRVAGMILYPNGIPEEGIYQLPYWIQNTRVLDENNDLVKELPPSKYLIPIIRDFTTKKGTKIFNHSIASNRFHYLKHMSTWGATLDYLSHTYEALIIQAAGNLSDIEILDSISNGYPDYLLKKSYRVKNPAQALHALSVGSISINNITDRNWKKLGDVGTPSAFTTTGYGIWNTIKPDIVDIGGDLAISNNEDQIKAHPELCPDLPQYIIWRSRPRLRRSRHFFRCSKGCVTCRENFLNIARLTFTINQSINYSFCRLAK
ncbi:peptidase, S8/S53 family [Leptospira borgpetersenii str. Noumea 25]|nr:peptidase, S8/S53 family [Leptospira borgpetersenii str. Noumea 25]